MKVESLADLAKHHIELWIIKGDYQPGEKLKEEEISVHIISSVDGSTETETYPRWWCDERFSDYAD